MKSSARMRRQNAHLIKFTIDNVMHNLNFSPPNDNASYTIKSMLVFILLFS